MAEKLDFDVGAAHKYFSAECFNKAWELSGVDDPLPACVHARLARSSIKS